MAAQLHRAHKHERRATGSSETSRSSLDRPVVEREIEIMPALHALLQPTSGRLKQLSVRRGIILVRFRRREEETDGCSDAPFAGNAYMAIDKAHESRHLRQAQAGSAFPLG